MDRFKKAKSDKKSLQNLFALLMEGTVIVEGKHDTEVLKSFGIEAIPYTKFSNTIDCNLRNGRTFYLLMDLDKGGEDKERKAIEIIHTHYPGCSIDTDLGRKLLRMLGCISVEQIGQRARSILLGPEF